MEETSRRSKPLTLDGTKSCSFKRPLLGEPGEFIPRSKADPGEPNIFQSKTSKEISRVYNKLLVTLGKWNADMYLKVQNRLNKDSKRDVFPACPELFDILSSNKCVDDERVYTKSDTYKHVQKDCKGKQRETCQIQIEEPNFIEPSYKNIFKNARNSRKTHEGEQVVYLVKTTSSPVSSQFNEKPLSVYPYRSVYKNSCELMSDEVNNYLLEVRGRKKSSRKEDSQLSGGPKDVLDPISAMFQDVPIIQVLQDNLTEQIEVTQAAIGERLTPLDREDEIRGLTYMKNAMLGADHRIDKFQDKFYEWKWRRKYDPDKIELSDEGDTTDLSEIVISDSSSLCSGDSLDTSIDGKDRRPKPSRIPFMNEVHHKRDSLYKKISMKWEKVVKKNLIEPNLIMTPIFRGLYTDIRLRSNEQFYKKILQPLDAKFEDIYSKKFVPYKYRLKDKIQKNIHQAENTKRLVEERKILNLASITGRRPREKPKVSDYTPTKYLTNNQRTRLKCIMKDVENMEKEGLSDWKKSTLVAQYVNLHPIISTKREPKMVECSPKKMISILTTGLKTRPTMVQNFQQPLIDESSTYVNAQFNPGVKSKIPKSVTIT